MAIVGFPNPVNEKAARTVAFGVLVLAIVTLALSLAVSHDWLWLLVPMVYGFAARVVTGPTLSPLGQLATRVIAPRLGTARPTAGPPKRFAQLIGLTVTGTALILTIAGAFGAAQIFLGMIIVAAGLESLAGYCLGCKAFSILMRLGVIPEEICEECANVGARLGLS
jgi:hypothetical protein